MGGSCAFARTLKRGQVVTFISAQAEGKLLFPADREKRILKELVDNDQVVFRFVDDRGKYAGYPWNPSGRRFTIPRFCIREGKVFEANRHPDRCSFKHRRPD